MRVTVLVGGIPRVISGEVGQVYFDYIAKAGFYGQARDLVPYNLCIGHDSICLDIGANIGMTALIMSPLCSGGKVYCFEPSPNNFQHLEANVADLSNCEPLKLALNDEIGDGHILELGPHSYLVPTSENASPVRMTTLDQWVDESGLRRIDFVKLDVEGNELQVLEGGRKTIDRFKPPFLIEFYTNRQKQDPKEFLEYLVATFPLVSVVDHCTGLPIPLERTSEAMGGFLATNDQATRVDDLLCYFDESQINPIARDIVRQVELGVEWRCQQRANSNVVTISERGGDEKDFIPSP